MASMREIQLRIKSVQDTMKITNAMYLISSSKMKRAKKVLDQTVPYFELLQSTIATVLMHSPDIGHKYFDQREEVKEKKIGYLVMTGDKGLCGSYNHNVVKLTDEQLQSHPNATLFVIGIMGRKYFEKKNVDIDSEFLYTAQKPNMHRARSIMESILNLFENKYVDEFYMIYTKMISPVKMEPQLMKLLPLEKHKFEVPENEKYKQITTFSPSEKVVLDYIVPNYIRGLIFGALIESFSSEHNSRMMAMDSATKSAKDMLSSLSLSYNRARQAAITQEITEVVSGTQNLGG